MDESYIVKKRIINQLQILRSLESRIESVLQNLKGNLLADIQDSELKVADQLRKVSLRAAGALAGVILEGHLQRVTQNHNISIRKKSPTIADLNDPLKNAGGLRYPYVEKNSTILVIFGIYVPTKKVGNQPMMRLLNLFLV